MPRTCGMRTLVDLQDTVHERKMIHVFFVPGMFGSTIEYALRSFTVEYNALSVDILEDGSMHGYKKEFHPLDLKNLTYLSTLEKNAITTPTYPFPDHQLVDIVEQYQPYLIEHSPILIYADSVRSAEINIMFQYHKLANGSRDFGLDMFFKHCNHLVAKWDPTYLHWRDMQSWQLREWFSLFYAEWVQDWIVSAEQVPDYFLKIKNTDILHNTKQAVIKIIDFCNLTLSGDIDCFIQIWQQKQKYIQDQIDLLDQIVEHTVADKQFEWHSINIISEAIIQKRLRDQGYEIKCNNLNIFPTNSKDLYNLLERC